MHSFGDGSGRFGRAIAEQALVQSRDLSALIRSVENRAPKLSKPSKASLRPLSARV